jgi:hypothetical protein
MHSLARTTLATAALALTATVAHADVVKLNSFAFGPAETISVTSPGYTGQAGEFSGTLNGNSFVTYCTDLLQNFTFGTTYTNYSMVSGVSAWGTSKSQEMDRLMSALMANGIPQTAAGSALAQALIWEVIYETGNNYNLSSGSFRATADGRAMQSAMNGLNWNTIDSTPIAYHVDKLYSSTNQDFLVVSRVAAAVPEPSSIALVAAAMAGLVFVARRKSRRA